MSRRPLFITYNYPPVGGQGLPGSQRAIKLIRNMEYEQAYVLTVQINSYPKYIELDSTLPSPVAKEIVYRTRVFDVFGVVLRFREFIYGRKKAVENGENHSQKSTSIWYQRENRSRWQRLKDFIFNLFYFPDDAGPWIIPAFIRGLRIIREKKVTLIFATGMPWSAMCVGWLLSKITRVPLIVDFRDPWINNPFHISKGKLLDKASLKLERKIVQHARIVFANTDELKAEFIERYPTLDAGRFATLPNGYDLLDYEDCFKSFGKKSCSSDSKNLVILHAGFLYGTRDPSPIIEAINRLSNTKDGENIVFCQIGKIDLDYDFRERYKAEIRSEKIILIGQLPFDECLRKMSTADVLLNIQPKTMSQVPSKLYDYLCLNRPILTITPLGGALSNLILKYKFGDVFPPDDVDGISMCIERLARKKREGKGTLVVNYSQRELFNIRRIVKQMSVSLDNAEI